MLFWSRIFSLFYYCWKSIRSLAYKKQNNYNNLMGEYDAVWVFLIATVFVGFYIFIEARPKGSTFLKDLSNTISRFFRKR